jgi:hypothetical protein
MSHPVITRLGRPAARGAGDASDTAQAPRDVIRRFFDLIERLERPFRETGARPAPEVKARITRLDEKPHRPS